MLELPVVDVRRSSSRARTRTDWLDSRHSLSFGQHYDPTNTSYGLLLAHNEDVLRPGGGFEPHRHADVEVVTWVLSGSLVHQDSTGRRGVVQAGQVQRMSAGSGVVHSERNDAGGPDAHYLQVWVASDGASQAPGYDQGEVDGLAVDAGLVPVLAGRGHDAVVRIGQRDAVLHAARLSPGRSVDLPDAPFLHLFVTTGQVGLDGAGALAPGDAVRLTGAGGRAVTATSCAEVLVWEMRTGLR